jgi:hypothetical protein
MDQSVAECIIIDNQPFSMTERKGFRQLMKTAIPLYEPPSRKTVAKDVDQICLQIEDAVRKHVKQLNWMSIIVDFIRK